jgi:membrane protease YdiL (CAAX protease family)
MSNERSVRIGRLGTLRGFCVAAALVIAVWLVVNGVATFRYFAAYGESTASSEGQSLWYRFFTADLTTASPLMMLATFLFPLYAMRCRRKGRPLPDWLSDGFPRHWNLFVIYLGLAATLFGMVVALSAVGTKDVSGAERQCLRPWSKTNWPQHGPPPRTNQRRCDFTCE